MEENVTGGMNGMTAGSSGEGAAVRQTTVKIKPTVYKSKDTVFAAVMFVIGFLYWELIRIGTLGAGVTIFTIVICLAVAVYMRYSGIKQNKRSLICLAVIALSAANFILFDGYAIKSLNYIFLMIGFIAWVCIASKRSLESRLSIYTMGDAISQMIIVPFSNCMCAPSALKNGISKNKAGKGFLAGAVGLVVFLPILIIVTILLTSADAAFESVITKFTQLVSNNVMIYILEFLVGIPVACYLFGLIYGDVSGRNTNHMSIAGMNSTAKTVRFAPRAAVYTAIGALILIYILFFLSQAAYLFSAFSDILPETMTYAEYARRGFFELCAVAAINLTVLTIAYLITKREEKVPLALRVMSVCLSIATILLIATAMRKMLLYIEYYGLTQLRIYTTWFMVLLLFCFVAVLVRQIKIFNASRILIVGFIVCFLALCYGNVDGMIAKYNIERYEQGTLGMMDEKALSKLSDAAVPYLKEAYEKTDDKNVKLALYSSITGDYGFWINEPRESRYQDYNIQKSKAEQIRKEIMEKRPAEIEEMLEVQRQKEELIE